MLNYEGKSEHFINFVIKGKEFDFEAFRSQEEYDRYKQELEEFLKETDYLDE